MQEWFNEVYDDVLHLRRSLLLVRFFPALSLHPEDEDSMFLHSVDINVHHHMVPKPKITLASY
jgi:hypothetical protein